MGEKAVWNSSGVLLPFYLNVNLGFQWLKGNQAVKFGSVVGEGARVCV